MATFIGTNKSDTLNGTPGTDVISGLGGNDVLNGMAGADRVLGGTGNDVLDGGLDNDLMIGGLDNDVYRVGEIGDVVLEGNGGGTDEVQTTLSSYALGSHVENLTYTATSQFSGTGNALSNIISGGSQNDTLTGRGGDDRLFGGAGRDTVVFAGKHTDYTITTIGGVTTVLDNNTADGNDGSDTLNGIERLQFADNVVIVGAPVALDAADLDGNNGFTLFGMLSGTAFGHTVSSAGDVNGDGFDDVIVGAWNTQITVPQGYEGESFVVFGKASWAGTPSLGVVTLDGTNGFRLPGIDKDDGSGYSVSSAGDVNGDGFADLIIGTFGAESAAGATDEGESYVVFGKASWAGTPSFDLATLDGTNGFRLIGIDADDLSGFSVSSAGDVNGDGFADVIVGTSGAESAAGATDEGESYVVFGKASWAATPSLDLATLDGTNGFTLIGIDADDLSGRSVSSAGDVNGDGFADLIVGARLAEGAGGADKEGESYVVFGKASWAGTPALDLATLDGTNGFRLPGIDADDQSGNSVSSAGDVNGDGFADLIVGANRAESAGGAYNEGESYVVFGKASWAGTPVLDLATLDGTNGFTLIGIDEGDGVNEVSSAGDVNGDGFDDVIIGADTADNDAGAVDAGESYVVYGKASWAGTPALDLATLDGTNGFRLFGAEGSDLVGRSVSSAGDVNGDGFDDVMVGALGASAEEFNETGKSYVVFGGDFTGAVTHLGTSGDDMLTGAAAAETFVGGTGNDTLIGKGGTDSFQGGEGDDVMRVSSLDFHLADGSNGSDTLALDGSGLHLDLTTLADSRTRSIERIDIGGNGNNTLTLSVLDVLNLSDESNELLVLGDAGDVVNQGPGWTAAVSGGTNGNGTSTIDGQTYQIYNAGQAALLLDTDMAVNV